ncbi:TPR repeat-containing protein [Fibrella aestuarina BUZ 2]|uniref:TPR repeat-containing protein n=1 Tax=Fibrella aestuarina BUZ 2 TaxID=1166018 RepID=I0K5L0_9BACT|nr:CHAT domain-containing tetratricopeptide repeat protein [Fibrella aestuarina]CCG99413.1 TPR repeat-containing protein [Fibrella aestuarina BUZ 2]
MKPGAVCRLVGLFMGLLSQLGMAQSSYVWQGNQLKTRADSLYVAGNKPLAEQHYRQLVRYYEQHQDAARTAKALTDLAVLQLAKREYPYGIRLLRRSLARLAGPASPDSTRFRAYSYLGLFFKRMGRFDSCQIYYDRATELLDHTHTRQNSGTLISYYTNQGVWEIDRGDYRQAELFLQKAHALLAAEPGFNRRIIDQNRAFVYLQTGRYAQALASFDEALRTATSADYLVIANKALCLLKLNRLSEARATMQQSMTAYRAVCAHTKGYTDSYFLAIHYRDLGAYYHKKRLFTTAIRQFRQSLAVADPTNRAGRSEAWRFMGQTLQEQGKVDQAVNCFQQAIHWAHPSFRNPDPYTNPAKTQTWLARELFRALTAKAGALAQLGLLRADHRALDASFDTYLRAIDLAEQMRRSYQTDWGRLFFTETAFDTYLKALEVTQQLYRQTGQPRYREALFTIAEQSRAATLTSLVREAGLKLRTLPTQERTAERALLDQLSGLQSSLGYETDSLKRRQTEQLLNETELAHSRLLTRFEHDYPAYYQLKYAPTAVSTATVQRWLPDTNTLLLSYTLLSNQLLMQAIDKGRVSIHTVPVDGRFFALVRQFRGALGTSPGGRQYAGHKAAMALYTYLIAPLRDELRGKQRLLILRDGVLNLLPFEVLAPKTGTYLLQTHTISYGYSAHWLLLMANHHPTTTDRLAMAPFNEPVGEAGTYRAATLAVLPHSGSEVAGVRGDVLLGAAATRTAFLENYASKRLIHLATHAITDDREPLRSRVAFFPDQPAHLLSTEAIYNLNLQQTSLVVLSACETGAGKLQQGEGVLSLARAFNYAGARAVLTTLWNAHDEASAFLLTRFQQHLDKGAATDEALWQAKLDFLKSDLAPRYDHPYFWANFVLIGPAEVIETPPRRWLWGLLGTLGVGGLGWGVRQYHTRNRTRSRSAMGIG